MSERDGPPPEADGTGAARSWKAGPDGDAEVAGLLETLVRPSRWDRLRGRGARWFVLHGVGLGDGRSRAGGGVDHLVIGPPGVASISTRNHPAGRVLLDGEQLAVNGTPTEYVAEARQEAERVEGFLRPALAAAGQAELAARVPVRPVIAVVGARLTVTAWPARVTVAMSHQLVERLRAFPAVFDPEQVAAIYGAARPPRVWNPAPGRS